MPQYYQPHVLLMGGTRILEKYVPGFESECVARGATMWDPLENMMAVRPFLIQKLLSDYIIAEFVQLKGC